MMRLNIIESMNILVVSSAALAFNVFQIIF